MRPNLNVPYSAQYATATREGHERPTPAFGAPTLIWHVAIWPRRRTGEGQQIDVSLYESIFRLCDILALEFDALGVVRERNGSHAHAAPHNHYPTADGKWTRTPQNGQPITGTYVFDGGDKVTKSTFELDQAILPFRLSDEWALITRTKLPVIDQPPKKKGDHWTWGFSNGYTTFFLSPEYGRFLYWGAGPVLYYPSATNSTLGDHRWGTGPAVALVGVTRIS
jgi:hypothetical protein